MHVSNFKCRRLYILLKNVIIILWSKKERKHMDQIKHPRIFFFGERERKVKTQRGAAVGWRVSVRAAVGTRFLLEIMISFLPSPRLLWFPPV